MAPVTWYFIRTGANILRIFSTIIYNVCYFIVHLILMLVVSVPFPKLNPMKVTALSDATVIVKLTFNECEFGNYLILLLSSANRQIIF